MYILVIISAGSPACVYILVIISAGSPACVYILVIISVGSPACVYILVIISAGSPACVRAVRTRMRAQGRAKQGGGGGGGGGQRGIGGRGTVPRSLLTLSRSSCKLVSPQIVSGSSFSRLLVLVCRGVEAGHGAAHWDMAQHCVAWHSMAQRSMA